MVAMISKNYKGRCEKVVIGKSDEVCRAYTDEMYATLLIPAGMTSGASVLFRNESEFLTDAGNADTVYVETILPAKMRYNLQEIRSFSLLNDLKILIKTVVSIWKPPN